MAISRFSEAVANLPLNPNLIGEASQWFDAYKAAHPRERGLKQAEAILTLKIRQMQSAGKLSGIRQSLLQFEQILRTNPQEITSNYEMSKEFLAFHRASITSLPDHFFTADLTRKKFLDTLTTFDAHLARMNPNAWKTDVLCRSLIAAAVVGVSASKYQWKGVQYGLAGVVIALGIEKSIPLLLGKLLPLLLPQPDKPAAAAPAPVEPASSLTLQGTLTLSPSAESLPQLHKNKQFVYDALTRSTPPSEPLLFSKHTLSSPAAALQQQPFQTKPSEIVLQSGLFAFPPSTEETLHWTADFADPHLLGFIEGPLLAQEELLAVEHPALYHLKSALNDRPDLSRLEGNSVALLKNVQRYGALNDLYGNAFASATPHILTSHLTRFDIPHTSHLFALAAPSPSAENAPYTKDDLAALYLRAYTAFSAMKENADGKQVAAHTGNWGCGAFGGSPLAAALAQLLAARTAGVALHYYPLAETAAFAKAKAFLDALAQEAPNATVDQILTYLADNAARLQIFWGHSNGT